MNNSAEIARNIIGASVNQNLRKTGVMWSSEYLRCETVRTNVIIMKPNVHWWFSPQHAQQAVHSGRDAEDKWQEPAEINCIAQSVCPLRVRKLECGRCNARKECCYSRQIKVAGCCTLFLLIYKIGKSWRTQMHLSYGQYHKLWNSLSLENDRKSFLMSTNTLVRCGTTSSNRLFLVPVSINKRVT